MKYFQNEPMGDARAQHVPTNRLPCPRSFWKYSKFQKIEKIAIGSLTILLAAATSVHAQRFADVPTINNGGVITSVVEVMNTFEPDRPSRIQQDSISHVMGTDVRSTSLRTDRPSRIQQDSISHVMGTCSDEDNDLTKPKGKMPMSILNNTDTCSVSFPIYVSELDQNFMYQQGYDTMRNWYIPHCYQIADPQETAGALEGSVQIGADMDSLDSLINYRNFVIHCLTLRNDDEWFCSFVADLIGTYTDSNDLFRPDFRAQRAINLYLMDNPRCAPSESSDSFEYVLLSQQEY
jgi:hypothetical protein